MASRRWLLTAMLIAVAILAATLAPDERAAIAARLPRGSDAPFPLADLLRNLLLFAPLGACLACARLSAVRALLAAAALSAFIELTQLAVPGRDPSLRDWVSNSAGSALAFAAVQITRRPLRLRSRPLVLVAGFSAAGILLGTGLLLAPASTSAP